MSPRTRRSAESTLLRARGDPDVGDGLRARPRSSACSKVSASASATAACARPARRRSTARRSTRWRTLAQSLGLDAEQVMMPVDHLLLAESEALPALVVVRLPSGLTHFVVVWRVHGDWVQVMDPGRGRRWARRASFLRDVYTHALAVPAAAFRDWAGSDGFTATAGAAHAGARHRATARRADRARARAIRGGVRSRRSTARCAPSRSSPSRARSSRGARGAPAGGGAGGGAGRGRGRRPAGRIGARDRDARAARRRRQRAGHRARRGAAAGERRDAARRRAARGAAARAAGGGRRAAACVRARRCGACCAKRVSAGARWRPAWRWRRSGP